MNPKKSYMICTTPRSGSNWLCDLIAGAKLAGRPREYFYEGNFPEFFADLGVSTFAEYVPELVQRRQTTNGTFGVKIMPNHFIKLAEMAKQHIPVYQGSELSTFELMRNIFPNLKYIWLTRRNRVRQAISYLKAQQTDTWYARSDLDGQTKQEREAEYNYNDINILIRSISLQDGHWQEYFTEAGIRPLVLVYEDFMQDKEGTLLKIFDYLEIYVPDDWSLQVKERSKRLSDHISEAWYKRYCQESEKEEAEWWWSKVQ